MNTLTIGDTTRDGLLRIVDTSWDSNGTLTVCIEDLAGRPSAEIPVEQARRLARRALPYPHLTRKSPVVRKGCACPCGRSAITIAVSRNPR